MVWPSRFSYDTIDFAVAATVSFVRSPTAARSEQSEVRKQFRGSVDDPVHFRNYFKVTAVANITVEYANANYLQRGAIRFRTRPHQIVDAENLNVFNSLQD